MTRRTDAERGIDDEADYQHGYEETHVVEGQEAGEPVIDRPATAEVGALAHTNGSHITEVFAPAVLVAALEQLISQCSDGAQAKGFHDDQYFAKYAASVGLRIEPPENHAYSNALATLEHKWLHLSISSKLLLIIGEVIEGHEELRSDLPPDLTYYSCKACGDTSWTAGDPTNPVVHQSYVDNVWAPTGEHCEGTKIKPEGIPAELADAIIRIMDLAGMYHLPVAPILISKLGYNSSRPHLHGRQF